MSAVPGINARHAIITAECRRARNNIGAFEEAVDRLRQEYLHCLAGILIDDTDTKFHLVLSVERKDA